MSRRSDNLDRFTRAVHRRWVVLRAVESAGVGVAVGGGLALLVLPVLLWRGEPAMPVVLCALATAGAAGLIAGVLRRPDAMSAAAEADRQLALADLLSTALSMRKRDGEVDPWVSVVLATAEDRCRNLSPNAIVLNRFGGRAWGGIGLTTALVLTLGLMSANPQRSDAIAGATRDHDVIPQPPAPADDAARASREPPQPAAQRASGTSIDQAASPNPTDATSDGDRATSDGKRSAAASGTDGAGGGSARTPDKPVRPDPLPQADAGASREADQGAFAAGGRETFGGQRDPTDAGPAGVTSSRDRDRTPRAPAWQSWHIAREQALRAAQDGSLPDDYRDLVREYFSEK